MSKAKPTHMRPVLEAAIDSGQLITHEVRKAMKWSLVTVDDLTARLAEAEARGERCAAYEDCTQQSDCTCYGHMKERLAAAEARIAELDNARAAAEIAGDALESQLRAESLERDALASELTSQAADAREARTERDEYKRLYDLRGKVLQRPCLQCGYTPSVISLAAAAARSAVEAEPCDHKWTEHGPSLAEAYEVCEKCGEERPYEPDHFDDDVI